MRRFAQPEVLKSATLAALGSALVSWPRLSLWETNKPLWYLVVTLFLSGIVLWGFVFAWHTEYTGRPVFTFKIEPGPFVLASVAGVCAAVAMRLFLDPALHLKAPDDYPDNLKEWTAMALFSLGFSQLCVVFAPLAWLIRLLKNRMAAVVLTVLFGAAVLVLQRRASPTPIPFALFTILFIGRLVMGSLTVFFYLRGGLLLAWWWGFLVEARHLAGFYHND